MVKNECGKTRKTDNPYEIWRGENGFEWRVLKKYQNPAKNKRLPKQKTRKKTQKI